MGKESFFGRIEREANNDAQRALNMSSEELRELETRNTAKKKELNERINQKLVESSVSILASFPDQEDRKEFLEAFEKNFNKPTFEEIVRRLEEKERKNDVK